MNAHLLSFAFAVLGAYHQTDARAEIDWGLLPPLLAIAEPQTHPPSKLLDRIEN